MTANPNQRNIYMKEQEREQADRLLILLQSQGVKLDSFSAMIKWLIEQELTRQQAAERRREGE